MENNEHLNVVNFHVLKAILDAGQERVVLASRDIFDERGVKLLARDRQLPQALQERLLERKLRAPLEASLRFEAGLDRAQLRAAFAALLASHHKVAQIVRPWAREIEAQINILPLDPVLLFLLTTLQATDPVALEHAVQAMAIAGAMSVRAGSSPGDLRLAMVAGLVHDMGVLELDPRLRGSDGELDLADFRALMTHPGRGAALLSGLKEYPLALSRAVGEHHERLDGSGYPQSLAGEAMSSLGRLLAVVETTLGVLSQADATLARASFALRVVPREYDADWVGIVAGAAAAPAVNSGAQADAAVAWEGLARSNRIISDAASCAAALACSNRPAVRAAALRAAHLLERLRVGWNDMGLWADAASAASASPELAMADDELRYRLSHLERDCLAQHADPDAADRQPLAVLWQCLRS
ncbi:MAG: HD domain-containing phosphohydrolase [Burkholderiaceae bacterium]